MKNGELDIAEWRTQDESGGRRDGGRRRRMEAGAGRTEDRGG